MERETATEADPDGGLKADYEKWRVAGIRKWEQQIPEKYAGASLDELQVDAGNEDAVKDLRRLTEILPLAYQHGLVVVLQADPGRGKTFLAWGLARALVAAPELGAGPDPIAAFNAQVGTKEAPINQVEFWIWPEILTNVKDQFGKEVQAQLLQAGRTVPLLFLDDVGAPGTLGSWAQGQLFELVNSRINAKLVTVVTTMLVLKPGVPCALHKATVSRLLDLDHCLSCTLLGPDRRTMK